jgi:hypothetical protein
MSDICRVRRQEMIRRAASEAALLSSRSIRWLWLPDAAPTSPSLSQLASAFGGLLPRHVLEPACDQDHSLPVEQETFDLPPIQKLIELGPADADTPQELGHATAVFVVESE